MPTIRDARFTIVMVANCTTSHDISYIRTPISSHACMHAAREVEKDPGATSLANFPTIGLWLLLPNLTDLSVTWHKTSL